MQIHTSKRSPTKRQVQLLAEQEKCTTIIQKGNNYFVLIPEYICNILYLTKLPAMNSSALIGGIFIKNPLQDLLSNKNALISNNESTRFITVHVPDLYTYKFQLKEYILTIKKELRRFLCIKI